MKKNLSLICLAFITITSFSQSDVSSFYAGDIQSVKVLTTTNNSWSNYSGTCVYSLYRRNKPSKTINFDFTGVGLKNNAGLIIMTSGKIKKEFKDTIYYGKSKTPLYIDSASLTKDGTYLYYRYYLIDTLINTPFAIPINGWGLFYEGEPLFTLTNTQNNKIQSNSFQVMFNNVRLSISDIYSTYLIYSGELSYAYKNDTIRVNFNDLENFKYLSNYPTSSVIHTKPLDIKIYKVTMDCSAKESPSELKVPNTWTGIKLTDFWLHVNSKLPEYKVSSASIIFRNSNTTYISDTLTFSVDTTYATPANLIINGFNMAVSKVNIKIPYLQIDSSFIKGSTNLRVYTSNNKRDINLAFIGDSIVLPRLEPIDPLFKIYPYSSSGKIFSFGIKHKDVSYQGIIDTTNKTIVIDMSHVVDKDSIKIEIDFAGLSFDAWYHRYLDKQKLFTKQEYTNYLTIEDYDGTLKRYKLIELTSNFLVQSNDDIFQIYPTISSDLIYIKSNFDNSEKQISIINIDGTVYAKLEYYEDDKMVDISNLTSGIYFLKIKSNDKSYIKKFIKN